MATPFDLIHSSWILVLLVLLIGSLDVEVILHNL